MNCPECNRGVPLGNIDELCDGDEVECPSCGESLEVVFLDGGGIALSTRFAGSQGEDREEDEDYPEPTAEWLSGEPYNCMRKRRNG